MKPAPLLVLAALLLPGCLSDGGGRHTTLHQVYDYARGELDHPFIVSKRTDELSVWLTIEPHEACEIRAPTRISVVDPDGKEALGLDAPPDCRAEIREEHLRATPGVWTLRFLGNGTLLAGADIREVEYPTGRSYVRVRG